MHETASQLSYPSCSDKDLGLTVAVVICTRNRPALLRNCLRGIALLNPAPDELIVVDNTTGDNEVEALAREFSARYIIEPVSGVSRARNRGLRESHSDIVTYIDDDAVPDERWLEFLKEPFSDPKVAVVTGEILSPELFDKSPLPGNSRTLDKKNPKWFEIAAYGGLGTGGNMALRRSACAGTSIFDERLGRGTPFHGMEEQYAFVRLISLNYCAVHVPNAIVLHPSVSRSSAKQEISHRIAYWLLLFFESPGHRADLLSFLFRRLRRKPMDWPRNGPANGFVVSSTWPLRISAGLAGLLLYLRSGRRRREQMK